MTSTTVLVADDDPIARKLIRHQLADGEFNVVSLDPEETFLEKVRALMPNVILLDVYLRDINGVELLTQVRSDPMVRDIPVLMITSDTSRATRDASLQAGADDLLEKPLDMSRLRAHLQMISRLQRRLHPAEDDYFASLLADVSDEALIVVDRNGYVRSANSTAKRWLGHTDIGKTDIRYQNADQLVHRTWEPVTANQMMRTRLANDGIPPLVHVERRESALAGTWLLSITDISTHVHDRAWQAMVSTMEEADAPFLRDIAEIYEKPSRTKPLRVAQLAEEIQQVTGITVTEDNSIEPWMVVESSMNMLTGLVHYLASLSDGRADGSADVHLRVRKGRLHLYTIYPETFPLELQSIMRSAEATVVGTLRESQKTRVDARHVLAYLQAWVSGGAIRLLKRTDKPTQVIVDLPMQMK